MKKLSRVAAEFETETLTLSQNRRARSLPSPFPLTNKSVIGQESCFFELFDVNNIYICNIETKDIFLRFYSSNTCSKVLYIMHVPISTTNVHLTNNLINLNTSN